MKIVLIALLISLLLCGCQTNIVTDLTEQTNSTITEDVPLSDLTDYELLCAMAQKKVCVTWATCSYIGEYPFSMLIEMSPEFAELMTRKTAAESISIYSAPIEQQYPDSYLGFLSAYAAEIEDYISKT